MRERVSRPYWSVPNQCSVVGPSKRAGGSSATGSLGATQGAKVAASATTRTTSPPTAPAPDSVARTVRQLACPPRRAARSRSAAWVAPAPSAIAHPWVYDRVEDIDEQVHQHER